MLTAGTITGIIVLSICALGVLVGLAAVAYGVFIKDGESAAVGGGVIVMSLVVAFIAQIGFMLVGFNGDYLAYHPVNGRVTAVASRMISDGQAMSTRYVFQIHGQAYGVDDTRAALIKPGDTVNLNCTKEFVWGSTSNGWACNWG